MALIMKSLKTVYLLRYTDEFDVPELAGKIEVRVEFKEVSVGTEVHIT